MSERYLCVNCWRTPRREETFFRCLECEGGGNDGRPDWLRRVGAGARQRLRDIRRPWYQRWFGGDGDRLGCPIHPEARLQLFCECGMDLPPEAGFQSRKPFALGFSGPRSSGKTLMTIAMVEELRGLEVAGRRIALNPLGDTEQRFHQLSSQLLQDGVKPAATDLEEGSSATAEASRNFCWKIYVDMPSGRRPEEEAFLAVYDVAGETWGIPAVERLARFDRYVDLVGSMVFLIDGAAVAADLGIAERDAWDPAPMKAGEGWTDRQWLTRVQGRLGPRAKQVDLALVLSKADYFWDRSEGQDLMPDSPPDRMEAALQELLRHNKRLDMWTVARRHFRRVRLFSVSSLGFHPMPGDVDPNGRLRRKVQPEGMAAPLSWLLKQRLAGLR